MESKHTKSLTETWLERLKGVKFGSVLLENGHLSKGRLMNWIVFGMLVYFWSSGGVIPPTLMESFWGLLVYNGGKKLTGPIGDYFAAKKIKATRSD